MAYDIGPRIGIEGEAEYRAQMNNIITQTKTLHAEMKTMKSAWDSDTSAKQKAAQQTKMLKEQISLQEQKLAQANGMLEKATAKYGENSNQALRWRQAVANARTELNNLNSEEVTLQLADPSRPCLILPVDQPENEDVLMLIMPMLLND